MKGERKPSVGDAEKLLSHAVADHFKKKKLLHEEEYVRTVALWHEASDGRGMTQEERKAANMRVLGYIRSKWMPWDKEVEGDLQYLDINK